MRYKHALHTSYIAILGVTFSAHHGFEPQSIAKLIPSTHPHPLGALWYHTGS